MNNRRVLIQAADGPHWDLLETARDHHRQYAERHGFDYWCLHGNPAAPKRAGWAKITLLAAALRMGYRQAVWLDADAAIVQTRQDIGAACPDGLGMVVHPNPAHWNTGVMIACNEPQVGAFLARVEAEPENNSAWMEQHAVNQLAMIPEYAALIHELPTAYNSTPGAIEVADPVILAAHGLPMAKRRRLIKEWLDPGLRYRHLFPEFLNRRSLIGEAVEVGVWRGEFAKSLLDGWRGRMLHLVDPWRRLPDYEDFANVSDEQHADNLAQTEQSLALHAGRFRIHRALSQQAVEWFGEESLDFVYIDANHERDHALADIRSWYPKVRLGGILAGHDYLDGQLPEGIFGVRSAVTQFEAETGTTVRCTDEAWPSWYIEKPIISRRAERELLATAR